MAGRPAGYSDEENSDEYGCYNDENYANHDEEVPTSAAVESPKDPWSTLILQSSKNLNVNNNTYDINQCNFLSVLP